MARPRREDTVGERCKEEELIPLGTWTHLWVHGLPEPDGGSGSAGSAAPVPEGGPGGMATRPNEEVEDSVLLHLVRLEDRCGQAG